MQTLWFNIDSLKTAFFFLRTADNEPRNGDNEVTDNDSVVQTG